MGVQEALMFGVPVIGVPLFGDQPVSMTSCVDKGIGIALDHKHLTADNIVTAVKTIINDTRYK